MAGYQYKGKEPITAPLPTRRRKRKPIECGTAEGARRHRHLGEKVCEPCRIAWNQREAERRGTPCDQCKVAINAYQRQYRARKKVAA